MSATTTPRPVHELAEPAPVPATGRVQLAIDVTDLDAAIAFYTELLGTGPAKVRPGYANFAVASPPLKLVLIEAEEGGRLNHLGVEVADTAAVDAAAQRLRASGLVQLEERDSACCYAVQDKVWVADPDGARWEVYTVLADAEVMNPAEAVEGGSCGCAAPTADQPAATTGAATACCG